MDMKEKELLDLFAAHAMAAYIARNTSAASDPRIPLRTGEDIAGMAYKMAGLMLGARCEWIAKREG